MFLFEKNSITSERFSIRHETQCDKKCGVFYSLINIIIIIYNYIYIYICTYDIYICIYICIYIYI